MCQLRKVFLVFRVIAVIDLVLRATIDERHIAVSLAIENKKVLNTVTIDVDLAKLHGVHSSCKWKRVVLTVWASYFLCEGAHPCKDEKC